jgi:hypothetical protein
LTFSASNIEFSVKFVISVLLNAAIILGFYSFDGERYNIVQLAADFSSIMPNGTRLRIKLQI